MNDQPTASQHHAAPRTDYRARIAVVWTVVLAPLAYGVFHAVKAATQLFTG
ncbi:hypothetical protein RDV89_11670 [Nocardioides zeae]|uniref:Uncharacterized protein n=1 Tax=Nocardioides imazamoxiresistens TaxID=3231893 RepID=A0ABU3PY83_9ACTN|nr:hypothetical protein [Nocardioides zeae]MDT9593730.1 hypothetical protein [Nocardioides zeae]